MMGDCRWSLVEASCAMPWLRALDDPSMTYVQSDPIGIGRGRVCLTVKCHRNNIVATQRDRIPMHITIRQIGNSQGIVIPKPLLAQVGLETGEAEITVEGGALVLRKPAKPVRAGWADAARKIAESDDDALVMGEFGNVADAEHAW